MLLWKLILIVFVQFGTSFLLPSFGRLQLSRLRCTTTQSLPPVELPWKSPRYKDTKLYEWWSEKESLLTVGKPGLTPTLINGVRDMMTYHWRFKLKVAHDRMDAWEIANRVVNDESMKGQVEILEVRKKMIMFGQIKACDPFAF